MPLYFVSPNQINAIVPFGINTNAPQQVLVQRGLALSLPVLVNVAAAQPSVFEVVTAIGPGGAAHPVLPMAPARAGDTLVLYCTGLGAVSPPVTDGSAPIGATSRTNADVQVTIGGQIAGPVTFSGLAPEFAGLYQVNVTLPAGTPPAVSAPLVVTAAGLSSQPINIAIE